MLGSCERLPDSVTAHCAYGAWDGPSVDPALPGVRGVPRRLWMVIAGVARAWIVRRSRHPRWNLGSQERAAGRLRDDREWGAPAGSSRALRAAPPRFVSSLRSSSSSSLRVRGVAAMVRFQARSRSNAGSTHSRDDSFGGEPESGAILGGVYKRGSEADDPRSSPSRPRKRSSRAESEGDRRAKQTGREVDQDIAAGCVRGGHLATSPRKVT